MKGEQRSRKENRAIRGPVLLPLSHYSGNNTAPGLSDPPPQPTSKRRNHPGVRRMSLQSCIGSHALLLINGSVSDSFRSCLYSLFPFTNTTSVARRTATFPPHHSADGGREGGREGASRGSSPEPPAGRRLL